MKKKTKNIILAVIYLIISIALMGISLYNIMKLYLFTPFEIQERLIALLFSLIGFAGMALFIYVAQYIEKRNKKAAKDRKKR